MTNMFGSKSNIIGLLNPFLTDTVGPKLNEKIGSDFYARSFHRCCLCHVSRCDRAYEAVEGSGDYTSIEVASRTTRIHRSIEGAAAASILQQFSAAIVYSHRFQKDLVVFQIEKIAESIFQRIESLRDQELLPQILELLQGYAVALKRLSFTRPGLLDIFASGMGSIFARQLKEEPYSGTPESMELVEADNVEKMMNDEKLVEIAVKVVWQGLSAAVSSLAEFAITSADEH
ncbi:hypothetical protein HID58_057328 [Brassica napus]|uniref:Uncharacterized protein n=1 Tax=Brassica napus TaxID=3708 RepID=A0ABQ8AQT3_BRANA|nr:hypothetical protein HID58_057328 [Brassica napus]